MSWSNAAVEILEAIHLQTDGRTQRLPDIGVFGTGPRQRRQQQPPPSPSPTIQSMPSLSDFCLRAYARKGQRGVLATSNNEDDLCIWRPSESRSAGRSSVAPHRPRLRDLASIEIDYTPEKWLTNTRPARGMLPGLQDIAQRSAAAAPSNTRLQKSHSWSAMHLDQRLGELDEKLWVERNGPRVVVKDIPALSAAFGDFAHRNKLRILHIVPAHGSLEWGSFAEQLLALGLRAVSTDDAKLVLRAQGAAIAGDRITAEECQDYLAANRRRAMQEHVRKKQRQRRL